VLGEAYMCEIMLIGSPHTHTPDFYRSFLPNIFKIAFYSDVVKIAVVDELVAELRAWQGWRGECVWIREDDSNTSLVMSFPGFFDSVNCL
jgi:hypothetical protein